MSTERILIHGTTAQRMGAVPALGQIGSDDDTKQIVLGDGATPGGIPMARADSLLKLVAFAATRIALAAFDGSTHQAVDLMEAGRKGNFLWNGSNLSAEVAADTEQGLFVAPASDPTGASGAWVRRWSGRVYPSWFGASGDGIVDDRVALIGAVKCGHPVEWGNKTYSISNGIAETISHGIDWSSRGATIKYNGAGTPEAVVRLNVTPRPHDIKGKLTFDGSNKAHVGLHLDNVPGSTSSSNLPSLVASDVAAVNIRKSVLAHQCAGILVVGAWELVHLERPFVRDIKMNHAAHNPGILGIAGIRLTRGAEGYIRRGVVVDPWVERVFCDDNAANTDDQDGIVLFSQTDEASNALASTSSMAVRGGNIINVRGRCIKSQARNNAVTGGLRVVKESSVIGVGVLPDRREIEFQMGGGIIDDVDFTLVAACCQDLVGMNIAQDVRNSAGNVSNIRALIHGVTPRAAVTFSERVNTGVKTGINVSNLAITSHSNTIDHFILFVDNSTTPSGQTIINLSNAFGNIGVSAVAGSGSAVSNGVVNVVNSGTPSTARPAYSGRTGTTVNRTNVLNLT